MLFEFIAVVFAGVGLAGIAVGLRKLSRGRLPKWIVPAVAGLGMIGTSVSLEYSWFESTISQMPEGTSVVDRVETQVFYKPWTYIWPQVSGFLAVGEITATDTDGENDAMIYRLVRWQTPEAVPVRVRCTEGAIARALTDGGFEPFSPLGDGDPILEQVCK